MPQSHQEPFWSTAMKLLPANSHLMEAVAEYLYMRIQKNPQLSVAEWEDCIQELLSEFCVKNPDGTEFNSNNTNKRKGRSTIARKLTGKSKPIIYAQGLAYYFIVATRRKWNHVYFTKEQDVEYTHNMSFYQNPYWHAMVNDPEIRKVLEAELNGQ